MDRSEAEAIYDSGREACVQFILDLADRVTQHEDRLKRLEEAARQDSRTSSKPPSTDSQKTRAQRRAEARAKAKELIRREGERRAAGGQPGHLGAGRELKPEDQVDEIVDHFPQACGGCGRRYDAEQQRPGGRFGRHQVCELPPISVLVTEHRTHQLRCRDCRARTSARLPDLIRCSPFGARLQAAVVTLTARHRISRRGICELARDLFGVTLCTGAVDAICQRASDVLAGPHLQLQDWVLDQGAVHVDETGWRTGGEGRALWTATTPAAAFFQLAEHCNREQFRRASARATPGLWSLTAGTASAISIQPAPSVLVAPQARLPPPRGRARRAEDLRRTRPRAHRPGVRRVAGLQARAPRPRPAQGRDRADPDPTTPAARRRQPEEQPHSLAPAVRQQPPQGLAGAQASRPHGRRAPRG